MNFTKMQAAGNDYVVIESSNRAYDWSVLARKACDRHYGIGADSLLILLPSEKADFMMRIMDADGSEAEACGNGIRCLARYVFEKGMISRSSGNVKIETVCGIRDIYLRCKNGKLLDIQANMGAPKFRAEEIPVKLNGYGDTQEVKSLISCPLNIGGIRMVLNLISMGNPHAVFFQETPVADFPMERIGPAIEKHSIFPNRTNFEVVRIINRKQVEARTWERGVGETLACGSGACAIAAAGQVLGCLDSPVEVNVTGGVLKVEWDGRGEVFLSGPAEIVFTGEWPEEVPE